MARPPRSNKTETKTKINDADRSRRKADAETKAKISDADRARRKARKTKLDFLRTFLLIAFTATSLASPSTGLAMAASIGAFDETCAPRTSPRRPSADELKNFAAELVDKRLRKLLTTGKGKALLQGNNAEDAVNAVLTLFFARLDDECARKVFDKTRSGESFETLEDLLRLSPKAAERAVEAYTKKPLGVYYYEVPFFEPDSEIVYFYESYRSDHVKDDATEFGPSFINKCRGKWKTGGAARVRYVGKRAQKLLGVIERGVEHFDDGSSRSGARFFSPVAWRVPKLYNACDANSRDARGVIAALLLDDLDVRELAKTLGMEPEKACEFAETVMMALLRTRCCDEDGGCGTNVNDGFMTFLKKTTQPSTSTNLLINRIVTVLTSNTGGMTYKEIATELKTSYNSVHNLMTSKDNKSKFKSETRPGHSNVLFFRLLKTGEAPAPDHLIDRVVDVLTSNTGGMTYEEIATELKTSYNSVHNLMTSKVHTSKFESETRPGHSNVLFFRLLKTGEALAAP